MSAFQMLNEPSHAVEEMLDGLVASSPQLTLVAQHKIVLHRNFKHLQAKQVTLLSGGGSGHEPAHAGYIGDGMLTGVICGDVFASPTTKQVLEAIRLVAGPHGCLLIVKNYTGDRLNFGLAIEKAKSEGLKVDMVVIGDDCAIRGSKAGSRGIAGTVFVHKFAGAMAAKGHCLESIRDLVRSLAIGSMGVAWKSCTLPGHTANQRIKANEMELGLGIHGEPGLQIVEQSSSKVTTTKLLDIIFSQHNILENDSIAILVNNLGSTTTMELNVIANDVVEYCNVRKANVYGLYVGAFMTALDMSGFSLSVWKLSSGDMVLNSSMLDYPVSAPSWPFVPRHDLSDLPKVIAVPEPLIPPPMIENGVSAISDILSKGIKAAAESIVVAEPQLTDWDAKVGDGDCGETLKAGAEAILNALDTFPLDIPSKTAHAIAETIANSIGGTSGVLYTIFFTAAGSALYADDHGHKVEEVLAESWRNAFSAGISAIQKYGGASEGSRTMMDALLPALRASQEEGDVWTNIVSAARNGAELTKNILPKDAFGRSSYVGEEFSKGIPDPGAMAVSIWLAAIQQAFA
ncbi:dihydroxyacetone kinase [Thraustotheca clavata]|uniref:Dihydroxyacetone kinase n=1 Tax=Thraustotheca clavata TaxID=74557 RepID=A0A1W0A219_9STRA|nr:dihydroxyacetone kinase [Thraustotheca clavata]